MSDLIKLVIRRSPDDELRVEYRRNGTVDVGKTYYAADIADARGTLRAMADESRAQGFQVEANDHIIRRDSHF